MQRQNFIVLISVICIVITLILTSFVSTRVSLILLTGIILAAFIFFKPFYGVLFYIILLYVRPQDFVPILEKLRIMLILAIIIMLSFLIKKMLQREKISIFHARQEILMFSLLIIVPLSNLANFRGSDAWAGFNEFLTLFIPFFLIINLVENFDKLRKISWTLVICTAIMSMNGIVQHFRGIDLIGNEPIVGRIRWIGIFGDPNDFALAMNTFIPFVLFNISEKGIKPSRRLTLAVIGILFILAIYYTDSRGGFLAFLTVLTFFVFKRGGITKGLIAGVFILVISILAAPGRMANLSPYGASASGRVNAWIEGLVILKSHPLLGVGFQNFELYHSRAAHNAFIQCMSELGLVGYFVWFALLYTCFSGLRKVEKAEIKHYSKYAEILQFSLIGFLASSIFLSQAYNPILYIIVALSTVVINNSKTLIAQPKLLTIGEIIKVLFIIAGSIISYKLLAIMYL